MLVKGLHAKGRAILNNIVKGTVFSLAVENEVTDPQVVCHDFKGGNPVASLLGHEALADDVTYNVGKAVSDLRLFLLVKKAEDAVNGLTGINSMQGTHHQVSCFGSREADLHGFPIAHFAHQDDLGCLAQGGTQPVG